jgi:hypothetical protein
MEMVNQASLVGFIKKIFESAKYTTDFVISVKRRDDDKWDDVLCKINNNKLNGWCREKNMVSVAGVLRTDCWPIGEGGKAVEEPIKKDKDGKFKDGKGEYIDKRILGWNSKTYLMVIAGKGLPQETASVFDKLVMDGITASSGSAVSVN